MIIEINTIHELLDGIDYYSILQVEQSCEQMAIGEAYRKESRRLHPDRLSSLGDEEAVKKANDIFSLVNEANKVLGEPADRAEYDQLMSNGNLRFTDEARQGGGNQQGGSEEEGAANNPKSEKYWKMALSDFKANKFKACVMNIQFAMTFEPGNEVFQEWMTKAKAELAKVDNQKDHNPYKLRIM